MMLKLSPATKEALKVAIAFTLSIVIAIALGWQKPYWAAISVIVVAANDNYNVAIKHGRNRLFGTIAGVIFAIFNVHYFAQDREMFIFSVLCFATICVYMSNWQRYGYAFKMAFTVGIIIAAMGQFDSFSTFDFAVLRVQETTLGILVYSLVFQFLWPRNTESLFKQFISQLTDRHIEQVERQLTALYLSGRCSDISDDENNQSNEESNQLALLLKEAISDSSRIYSERKIWMKLAAYLLDAKDEKAASTDSSDTLKKHLQQRYLTLQQIKRLLCRHDIEAIGRITSVSSMKPIEIKNDFWGEVKNALIANYQNRLIYVFRALAALSTCYALWIYLPMPAGILFPLIASSFVNALCDAPSAYYKYAVLGICTFSVLFLLEYIFILPALTEVYELAAFYFINIFLVWKMFAGPQLSVLRVLGGNMLVVLTMTALYLTPVYSITQSLNMLLFIFIILIVVRFYTMLTEEIGEGMMGKNTLGPRS